MTQPPHLIIAHEPTWCLLCPRICTFQGPIVPCLMPVGAMQDAVTRTGKFFVGKRPGCAFDVPICTTEQSAVLLPHLHIDPEHRLSK